MRKTLLSTLTFVFTTMTFAQVNLVDLPKTKSINNNSASYTNTSAAPATSSSSSSTYVIWEDDCDDASTWTFTNTSTLGIDWYVESDPNLYPAASSAGVTPLAMSTASNGFLFISSDYNNTTDFDGTPIIAEATTATPIDLTNFLNVQLTFQSAFRWWHDTRIVRISPDNGVTWVDIDEISNEQTYSYPAQTSNNPHMSVYDISAVAGGQSEVLVQFYYNDNDYWGWFWPIDDVAISELPDNLVVSSDESMGGWWIGYQGPAGGLGQDYTYYPLAQATANPYAFECVLRNGGIATQEATLKVEVEDGSGSNVYSGTSNPLTLAQGQQDTVATTSQFTPSAQGLYTIEMWGEVDSAGAGNVITYTDTTTKMSMVTDYIYGKDLNSPEGTWRLNRVSPQPGGFEVSSTYDIYSDVDLYSVDVHIADWSIPGSNVYAVIYEEDLAGGDPIPLDQSDDYTITQADVGAWVTIPFISPQALTSTTKTYRIAVGANLHPTDSVGVSVSGLGEYSADGLLDKDGILDETAGQPGWYTIGDIPMLRMNFNPTTTAVTDAKTSIFNIFPNPTNGFITIGLDNASKYELSVINVLGQNVYTSSITDINTSVDLSSFETGVYTIELTDGNRVYSDKLIIE